MAFEMVRRSFYTPAEHAFLEQRSLENMALFYLDELTRIGSGEKIQLTKNASIVLRRCGLLKIARTRVLTEKACVLLRELKP